MLMSTAPSVPGKSVKNQPSLRRVPAANVSFALAALLGFCALLPPGPARLLLLSCLSATPLLLALRREWGADLLLASPLASLFLWAPLGFALWKVHLFWFAPGLLAALALGLALRARRHGKLLELRLSTRDLVALIAFVLLLLPIGAVFTHNGMEGGRYLAHSWFGRDTFYLFGLAQEAAERQSWPAENPFAAGLHNYYPSLIHVALGALSTQGGSAAAIDLVWISPLYLACGPALWVLAAAERGRASWLVLVGAAGPFLLRPDLFIYPHTQAYSFCGLALILWLTRSDATPAAKVVAWIVGVEVVLAHSVVGALAVVLLGGQAFERLVDRATRREGVLGTVGVVALGLLFLRGGALPYPGAKGPLTLHAFSGIGAFISPWQWPLAAALIVLLANARQPLKWLPTLASIGLGLAYYAYGGVQLDPSDHWFVLFNAERFFHLALLIALPLVALRPTGVVGAAVLSVMASALIHPTDLAKGSRALLEEAPLIVEAPDLLLFQRIRAETPPEARFITNWGGWLLPAFTGRAEQPVEGRETSGAQSTVLPQEYAQRYADGQSLLRRPPHEWPAAMDRFGYTHVLLRGGAPSGDAQGWVASAFPPGTMKLDFAEGRGLVLERLR